MSGFVPLVISHHSCPSRQTSSPGLPPNFSLAGPRTRRGHRDECDQEVVTFTNKEKGQVDLECTGGPGLNLGWMKEVGRD